MTASQPKFERGDPRYQRLMKLASEIIARSFESMASSLPDVTDKEVVSEFLELDSEIRLMQLFRGLNVTHQVIANNKNSILIFGQVEDSIELLEIQTFKYATEALRTLFELESQNPDKDIVLVRGDSPEAVRESFKNYFSDATHFVDLIERGCEQISGKVLTISGLDK